MPAVADTARGGAAPAEAGALNPFATAFEALPFTNGMLAAALAMDAPAVSFDAADVGAAVAADAAADDDVGTVLDL